MWANIKWNPPPLNWLKCNTDVNKIPNNNLTSIELAWKDSNGRILLTSGKKLGDVPILMAEAVPMREAFRATTVRHIENIVVESNCG